MLTATQSQVQFCPACAGTARTELGKKNGLSLSRCLQCSTVSIDKPSSPTQGVFDYLDYYSQARFEDDPASRRSIQSLVTSLNKFKETRRWLDMGFGEGALLRAAEKEGWSCFGTEVSRDALAYGTGREWEVSADPETDPRFQAGGFDVVTMIEFIEHVLDPAHFIASALKFLRPGGALYLTTPNARSLNARLLGISWSVFAPPEHATIWSPRGLASALSEQGFEIVKVKTEGLNPAEIIARYRNRSRVDETGECAPPVNRNQAAFTLNAAFSSSPFRR
ncbi:MAG: class I SAM-dependent methyltransferase, partial [Blastocatellia bacterium]